MDRRNLPTIDARYWTAILAASMCGANTGDFASRILGLGHTRGLLPLGLIFLAIVWAERRSTVATEAYYWLAIIVLRTAATNLADLGTHDLKLGYFLCMGALVALMAAMLLVDRIRGVEPMGITDPDGRWRSLPATDTSYWITMLAAGTLGTAAGDWVAEETGLGLSYGSAVLALIFVVVWFVSDRFGKMTKPWYWLTVVAARTAGTALGDLLASRRGLGLGLVTSTICTSLLLAGIVLLWRDRGRARLREA
ncbi:MAG TPA: hypothetical protein VH249_07070 [Xanthobacteraceae bacterium]|nr:hypothetical protein [Xanthobacteraceae bacterium]